MLPSPDDPTYELSFVAELIATQCPQLLFEHVTRLGRGWDCDVFALDASYTVRMARS